MEKACFELKGSLFTLSVLQLFGNDLSLLEKQLKERIKMAPGFFNHTPFVIDLHEFTDDSHTLDFFALKKLFLSLSMIPVGVKGAEKSLHSVLEKAGLAILAETKNSHKNTPDPETEIKAESIPSELEPEPDLQAKEKFEVPQNNSSTQDPTKIVRRIIRSGQQVYATNGDLIVIGSVSTGAEILASGNIHIYGTLRGRALAGIHGNQSATIFCHSLQAELYSIAGFYLLSDDLPQDKIGTSVQIFLENDKLQIESI